MMIEKLDASGWDDDAEVAGALLMERSLSRLLPQC
jgi:hypothetical protein